MKIYLASDHAGLELKDKVKKYLTDLGHTIEDLGPERFDPEDDYPDLIRPAAEAVARDSESRGIIFGGSGQGEAMVANRIAGVRAIVFYGGNWVAFTENVIRLSRDHNDSNVLSIGARFVDFEHARPAIDLWLKTPFSKEERHVRRVRKIDNDIK
ncbi:MAG: RpiB/LacA/LacB family sugar-phosphate isomerase [Candidatus Niyogibacteria bacterium]|nr:RpiB/LacA/LacB family sugar-phosphate isomerase [Candidatus Niyogibacteria bacterium]